MFTIHTLTGPTLETPAAVAINIHGDIVGTAHTWSGGVGHVVGVRWRGAMFVESLPVGSGSFLYGVNDAGRAVGLRGFESSISFHAMSTLPGGAMADVRPGEPDFVNSIAGDINDAGACVGYRVGGTRGFVVDTGTDTVVAWIDPPVEGGDARPVAINAVGDVVGKGSHPFHYANGSSRWLASLHSVEDVNDQGLACGAVHVGADFAPACLDLRDPAASPEPLAMPKSFPNGVASGINNAGVVVGTCWNAASIAPVHHAFVSRNGRTILLDDEARNGFGIALESALDLNDHGDVVGTGRLLGIDAAFLATSRLEPGIVLDARIVGHLIGAVAIGGGGFLVLPNGDRVPVPPRNEWQAMGRERRSREQSALLARIAAHAPPGEARDALADDAGLHDGGVEAMLAIETPASRAGTLAERAARLRRRRASWP